MQSHRRCAVETIADLWVSWAARPVLQTLVGVPPPASVASSSQLWHRSGVLPLPAHINPALISDVSTSPRTAYATPLTLPGLPTRPLFPPLSPPPALVTLPACRSLTVRRVLKVRDPDSEIHTPAAREEDRRKQEWWLKSRGEEGALS